MAFSYSPLRYPGGKSRLTNFIKLILQANGLEGGSYVEAFAGGAGVAMGLLFDDNVEDVYINDIDPSIYAFWHTVLNDTEALCKLIVDTPITIEEWHNQKYIFEKIGDGTNLLATGFSTFFLNRTNRSGILNAGVIGGKKQDGPYKLDARFKKNKLIKHLEKIALLSHRIHISNLDSIEFLKGITPILPDNTLIYLDPPYYNKGQGLYINAFEHNDHAILADYVQYHLTYPWLVSYDNTPEIRELYSSCHQEVHELEYSAHRQYRGREVVFSMPALRLPTVKNPFSINRKEYNKYSKLLMAA